MDAERRDKGVTRTRRRGCMLSLRQRHGNGSTERSELAGRMCDIKVPPNELHLAGNTQIHKVDIITTLAVHLLLPPTAR